MRHQICNFLILFFGYFFPALSSAKAILTCDDDGIREWLTYWSVFSSFYVIEGFIDIFLWTYPFRYELKILFVLWLTLPRFQGAYNIYTFLIKPYFEQYENHIDDAINQISEKIKVSAYKRFQAILWHILCAPEQSAFIFRSLKSMGLDKYLTFLNSFEIESKDDDKEDKQLSPKELFKNFNKLIRDGLYLPIGFIPDNDTPNISKIILLNEIALQISLPLNINIKYNTNNNTIDISNHLPNKVKHMRKDSTNTDYYPVYIYLYAVNSITQLQPNPSILHINLQYGIDCPVAVSSYLMQPIIQNDDVNNIPHIPQPTVSTSIPTVDDNHTKDMHCIPPISNKEIYLISDIYIQSEDEDQCETLVMGLQMTCMAAKSMLLHHMSRLFSRLNSYQNYLLLVVAWRNLKRFS